MENQELYKEVYKDFIGHQIEVHEKNQKKIKVGLKVNILLPLVFLIISFMTNGSKLIFLILWVVSLFGIAFYLLYIEFTDFKMQETLKKYGIVSEEEATQVLIGAEVQKTLDELSVADLEVFDDIKELKTELSSDINQKKEVIKERKATNRKKAKEIKNKIKNVGGSKDEKHS